MARYLDLLFSIPEDVTDKNYRAKQSAIEAADELRFRLLDERMRVYPQQ